jgi:hypothetical protein
MKLIFCLTLSWILLNSACTPPPPPLTPPPAPPKEAPTNRIEVPAQVRKNLGITFVKAEKRSISQVLRVPGSFELLPEAYQDYQMLLPGTIEILVTPYEKVKEKQALFRIHSKAWFEFQEKILQSQAEYQTASFHKAEQEQEIEMLREKNKALELKLEANERHSSALKESENIWLERIAQLEKLTQIGGGRASEIMEAKAQMASIRTNIAETTEERAEIHLQQIQFKTEIQKLLNQLPRLEADIQSHFFRKEATRLQFQFYQKFFPTLEELSLDKNKRWFPYLEICAQREGMVYQIQVGNGSWVEENSKVLQIVSEQKVGFRAYALQSDFVFLHQKTSAFLIPSPQSGFSAQESLPARFQISPRGNSEQRTLELFAYPEKIAPWAYAGVGAFLEIVLKASEAEDIAIPAGAILQDGLTHVFFRRDSQNPDRVIRVEADMGVQDGRWVSIYSDLKEGDEVVLEGVYELKLASSSRVSKGGHYHPDGTWHDKED